MKHIITSNLDIVTAATFTAYFHSLVTEWVKLGDDMKNYDECFSEWMVARLMSSGYCSIIEITQLQIPNE